MIKLLRSVGLLSLFVLAAAHGAENKYRVTVSAGDFERRQSVVNFALPDAVAGYSALRDGNKFLRMQVKDGQATFILDSLAKGASKTYELIPIAPKALFSMVQSAKQGDALSINLGQQTILRYQAQPSELPRDNIKKIFQRGGYIHPVYSPSGKIITDDYPANHLHHHGIWFAWTKTEFQGRAPDFWNMGEEKGRVEFVALDDTWTGPVYGGFRARHRYVDLTGPEPVTALNEVWEVKVYNITAIGKPTWVFDFTSTQRCATNSPLKLPQYHYGGMAFRGNWQWNGKENAYFLTSEGETNRVEGNTTQGRWCHIGGKLGGGLTGTAILCHPDNFRAPQPMRIHPTEPYFCYAPQQAGDMSIKPGDAYVSRYRFIVQDGAPDVKQLDTLWNDYAHPVEVKVAAAP